MRVSDGDRERVAEVLRDATGQGRITFEELEERLGRAYTAKTYAELEAVVVDLPKSATAGVAGVRDRSVVSDRVGGHPGGKFAVAIMAGSRRRGTWVVPKTFIAFALMGGVEIDLREARFSEREVTIHAYTVMGGVDIISDYEIEMDVSGFGLMGGVDHEASGPGAPGAPRVRVVGFALMGGVGVRRKPPKGSKKRDQVGGGKRPEIRSE
ncbi:MAG TPA: DUF1707 domain-containing protein [Streptosporangiaceae bacterium]|nr:DUF1707 domain-containing protein [Streptosporangiaceae bacterium]